MPDETRIVAVKLTGPEREAAEQLVAEGHYKTLSALLRMALVDLLFKHELPVEQLAAIRLSRVGHPMRRRKREGEEAEEGP